MPVLGNLDVTLRAMTAEFSKDMKSSMTSLEAFSKTAKKVVIATGAASAAMAVGIHQAISAIGTQESAELRLASAIAATGSAANADAIKGYAAELQKLTTVGDEVAISAAAMLTSMGLTQDQIRAMLPAIADFSAATGTQFESAAQILGRAVMGNAEMLGRYGVQLSGASKETLEFGDQNARVAEIVGQMDARFKGTAETLATTGVGAMQQMKNATGDLVEVLGKLVSQPFAEQMGAYKKAAERAQVEIGKLTPAMQSFIGHTTVATGEALALTSALFGSVAVLPNAIKGFQTIGAAIGGIATFAKAASIGIAKLLAVGAGVAALAGSISILRELIGASEEKKAEMRAKMGVSNDAGLLESVGKVALASVRRGFEPLNDVMNAAMEGMSGFIEGTFGAEKATKDAAAATKKSDDALRALSVAGGGAALKLRELGGFDFGGVAMSPGDTANTMEVLAESLSDAMAEFPKEMDFSGFTDALGDVAARKFSTDLAALPQLDGAPTIAPAFAEASERLKSVMTAVNTMLGVMADQFLSKMGPRMNEVANAAMQGMQAGPWGAVAAVGISLLSQTQGVQDLFAMLEGFLGTVVSRLEPMAKAMTQLLEPLLPLALLFFDIAYMFFWIGPMVELLGKATQGFSNAVAAVVVGLAGAWNYILEQLAQIARWFKLKGVAKDIRKKKVDANDMWTDIADAMDNVPEQAERVATSISDSADAMSGVASGLTNVPTAWKYALDKYGATDPNAGRMYGAAGEGANGVVVNILGQTVIAADNPVDLAAQLVARAEWSGRITTPANDSNFRGRMPALGLA